MEHAIQVIQDRIRSAWGRGSIVSLIMLDVSGAYDNVSHARIIHNLQKGRLGQLAPYVQAFLTGWSTRIRMSEGILERSPTPTGIPQGSLLSPNLYVPYNTDLLKDGQTRSGDLFTLELVDDVSFMATGKTEKQTTSKLEKACEKARIWASRLASVFDLKKYNLKHFVPPERKHDGHSFLLVEGQDGIHNIIFPEQAARYLCFSLDPQPTFSHHHNKAIMKGSTSLQPSSLFSYSTLAFA